MDAPFYMCLLVGGVVALFSVCLSERYALSLFLGAFAALAMAWLLDRSL